MVWLGILAVMNVSLDIAKMMLKPADHMSEVQEKGFTMWILLAIKSLKVLKQYFRDIPMSFSFLEHGSIYL